MSDPRATPLYEYLIMESLILPSLLVLLQLTCMVLVVACHLMRSSIFSGIPEGHLRVKIRSILLLVSGALRGAGSR